MTQKLPELSTTTSTYPTLVDSHSHISGITEAFERLQITSKQSLHHNKSTGLHRETSTSPPTPENPEGAQKFSHPKSHCNRPAGLHLAVSVRVPNSGDPPVMTFPPEATTTDEEIQEELEDAVNTRIEHSRVGQEQALNGDEGDGEWVGEDLCEDGFDGSAVAHVSVEMEGVKDEGWLLLAGKCSGWSRMEWELLGEWEVDDEILSRGLIEVKDSVDSMIGN
ncbi:hypothetical protein HOY82DRAFT_536675 [Tuber indicum]|nr:hypothetical protein HOY82DRAFT_536675 [Tuber indicum]